MTIVVVTVVVVVVVVGVFVVVASLAVGAEGSTLKVAVELEPAGITAGELRAHSHAEKIDSFAVGEAVFAVI